jgi:SAM-dependent methyltransferase
MSTDNSTADRFPGARTATALLYKGRNLRYRFLFDVLRRNCSGEVLDVGGGSFVRDAVDHGVTFDRWHVVEPFEADLPNDIDDARVVGTVGDGTALDFADDSFDTVLSISVLEHTFDPTVMITELCRVCRPDGRIVLMAPQTANLHHAPHHYQNLTRFWFEEAARRADAEIIEYQPLGGAWSTMASRTLLYWPSVIGLEGYRDRRLHRGWKFWALQPLAAMVAVVVFPLAMILSLADLKEEANNHVVVMRKGSGVTSDRAARA